MYKFVPSFNIPPTNFYSRPTQFMDSLELIERPSMDNLTHSPHPDIKYLILGILRLDCNPAFDSEVAAWLDNNNLVNIYAYIHPEEEVWMSQLFNLLNTTEFAPLISSIEIKGPDKGTNGTRLFDLGELLKNKDTQFIHLTEFEVEQTSILHENITMVTYDDYYDDNGAGGRILDKMPNLKSLILPSAPNPDFFNRKEHPLNYLSLQAGYEHQGFISKLSNSKSFPDLIHFEWTDGPGKPRFTSCVPYNQIQKLEYSPFFNFTTFNINSFHTSWNKKPTIS